MTQSLDRHLRKRFKLPADWECYRVECKGQPGVVVPQAPDFPPEQFFIKCTGAVPRGYCAKRPRYIPNTCRVVYITLPEYRALDAEPTP